MVELTGDSGKLDGLSQMKGVGGKAGWSWIVSRNANSPTTVNLQHTDSSNKLSSLQFIIEGLLTFIVGVASPWMVQDWPEQATFLTPLERANVLYRLKADSGLNNEGKFSWKVIRRAVSDWKTWMLMLLYIGVAEPLYSMSIFAPTIIKALGSWSTPQSLLLSTPPYAWAFITTMSTAYLSDKTGRRAFFLMFWTVLAVVGYILFLTVPHSAPVSDLISACKVNQVLMFVWPSCFQGALYFSVFLTLGAIAPCIATTIVWAGNTFGNHYKKATSMGMVFSLGNSGGIVASLVYRNEDAPRYIRGHAVTLGFAAVSLFVVRLMDECETMLLI